MTKPLFEPSTPREVAGNSWGVSQLQRRPAEGSGAVCGDWHYVGDIDEPPFENDWENAGGALQTLRFAIRPCDLILEGCVVLGSSPSVVFTLPLGFRPPATIFVPGSDDGGSFIAWEIDADGSVIRL